MPTSQTVRRTLLNAKTLTYILGGLLLFYLSHDIVLDVFESNDDQGVQDRTKREADKVIDESMIHYEEEDDPLSRLARKILNESESFVEQDGKKKPIPVKELNKNYKEAKNAFYAPKPDCIPKPAPGATPPGATPPAADAPAGDPPAEPPAAESRRKRAADKLPYCEDVKKKDGAAAEGGAAPPADAAAPPAEEPAGPPPDS